MIRSISSHELSEWIAYFKLEQAESSDTQASERFTQQLGALRSVTKGG